MCPNNTNAITRRSTIFLHINLGYNSMHVTNFHICTNYGNWNNGLQNLEILQFRLSLRQYCRWMLGHTTKIFFSPERTFFCTYDEKIILASAPILVLWIFKNHAFRVLWITLSTCKDTYCGLPMSTLHHIFMELEANHNIEVILVKFNGYMLTVHVP